MGKLPEADARGDVGHVELAAGHLDLHAVLAGADHALQPPLLAACDGSGSTSAPPSAVVRFLLAWKLKDTKSPKLPTARPFQLAPNACAASSTTRRPCLPAMA